MATLPVPIARRQAQQAAAPNVQQRIQLGPNALEVAGEVIGKGVNVAAHIAQKEIEKQNDAAVMGAAERAGHAILKREQELNTMKGVAAIQHSSHAAGLLDKDLEDIENTLNNDAQKAAFRKIRAEKVLSYSGRVNSYTNRESDKLFRSNYSALVSVAAQNAATATTLEDPKEMVAQFNSAIADINRAVDVFAKHEGMTGDQKKDTKLSAMTELHSFVLSALVDRDMHEPAKKYMSAHKDEIHRDVLGKLGKKVAAAGKRVEIQDLSDEIIETHTVGAFEFNLGAALDDASTIGDVDTRKAVEDKSISHNNRVVAARRANDSPKVARLDAAIEDTGFLDRSSDDFISLSDEGKATAIGHARSRQLQGRREQSERDEIAKWSFYALDPAEQASIDINSHPVTADASSRMRHRLAFDQQKVIRDGGVGLRDFRIEVSSQLLGKKLKPKEEKAFRIVMDAEYIAWKQRPENLKEKPKPEDVALMMVNAQNKVEKQSSILGFWNRTLLEEAWKVHEGRALARSKGVVEAGKQRDSVPREHRERIIKFYKAKNGGRAPSNAEILGYYQQNLNRK
jgi:hypothetical protein